MIRRTPRGATSLVLLAVAFPPPAAGIGPKDALKPFIHSRTEWKAENAARIPLDKEKTRIVVHHTANFVTDGVKTIKTNKASWKAAVDHVHKAQDLHKRVRGWSDVGYHYMIDWKGRIFQGRPVDRLGAHTEGNNRGSIGVVLLGDFSRQRPPLEQVASLKTLLRWLISVHKISPKDIRGHQQYKYTLCPGKNFDDPSDPRSPLRAMQAQLIIEGLDQPALTRK
ncbi:MAG: peptidoglycan recognition protein family protein [Elusimicrobiota bacterium]|nr:MAG: peptidoglycan recognition protein family protein [Elusimicrobiota bacterium]